MEAPHTRAPTTETMYRLTATGALITEITDRLTAMEALITEVTDHLTAMGAWSWEAIETVMQIATTTDVMQAAEAMQQVEGQEKFAARRPGPRHRTLPMQIIVYDEKTAFDVNNRRPYATRRGHDEGHKSEVFLFCNNRATAR
jgi:hypothetical protein